MGCTGKGEVWVTGEDRFIATCALADEAVIDTVTLSFPS